MSSRSAILPDSQRLAQLVNGTSPLGQGPFWLINMLKFKPGGVEEYRKYAAAVKPLMEQVGAFCVFRLYDNVQTVINGDGVLPDWDGVFIGSYPSPEAFQKFSSSEAYRIAHKHRAVALEATEMYACAGSWATDATAAGFARGPTEKFDMGHMPEAELVAAEKAKDERRMAAIGGDPERFMAFLQDDRFAAGRVWMLNLLKYEPGKGKMFYSEYGARAQRHIGGTMKQGSGGGVQLRASPVFTLKGADYDDIAVMQYPSRMAFAGYAMGSDRKGDKTLDAGFVLRTAGLAVQGLVCLGPESDPDCVQDPRGPRLQATAKL